MDSDGAFVAAKDVRPGDTLVDDDGNLLEVEDVRTWTQHRRVHNLTVDGIHTYYALAGDEPLLTHNCASGKNAAGQPCKCSNGPNAYTAAFEMRLKPGDYGKSRKTHFSRANEALDDAMQSDPDFAKMMESIIPGVGKAVSSKGGRKKPPHWTWQHEPMSNAGGRKGVLRLVPTFQHKPGSVWQSLLHPGGKAGIPSGRFPPARRRTDHERNEERYVLHDHAPRR